MRLSSFPTYRLTVSVAAGIVLAILLACWIRTRTREAFYVNTAQTWRPAQCRLGGNVRLNAIPDVPSFSLPSCDSCGALPGSAAAASYTVKNGDLHVINADTSPRYLDRAFASCDPDKQAMAGFRINTENVGSDGATLQASAMCTRGLPRSGNTRTFRTAYKPASDGAAGHIADCGAKALVAMGFETMPEDDDQLRLRYDCAYDVEVDVDDTRTFYSGWRGNGSRIDSYDVHSVKCPLPGHVLTRVEYRRCPNTQEVTAVYDCVPVALAPQIVIDNSFYVAEPAGQPSAVLTRDVSGDMRFDEEIKNVFAPFGEHVKGAALGVGKIAENAGKGVGKVGQGLGDMFGGVGQGVVHFGNRTGDRIKTAGDAFVKEDVGKISNAFTSFPSAVQKKVDLSVKTNIKPVIDSVGNIGPQIKKNADGMKDKIAATFNGIIQGIPKLLTRFATQSRTCFEDAGKAWRI